MAKNLEAVDLKKAMLDPATAFAEPHDIVRHPGLSTEQKLQLLRQWERDAVGLSVAAGEGMAGGEESRLQRVRRALDALGHSGTAISATPQKPPG